MVAWDLSGPGRYVVEHLECISPPMEQPVWLIFIGPLNKMMFCDKNRCCILLGIICNREFKKTTTATGTSLNKWFNEWEQWLFTCVIILGTFLCRSLQNNNVKWPNFALCEEVERVPQGIIFEIYISNWFNAESHNRFRDSLDKEKQAKWLKSIARFVSKIKSIFNRRCPRRRLRSFFSSLILSLKP